MAADEDSDNRGVGRAGRDSVVSGIGHNWLATVAADIRALHAGIRRNAEQAASDTIEAGKLLIETAAAKAIDDRVPVIEIRWHARRCWRHLLEAGRQFGAVRDEIGEAQFRAWVSLKTGFNADEALLLAEAARVTDAGGVAMPVSATTAWSQGWMVGQ
jgi:hypothetical protein